MKVNLEKIPTKLKFLKDKIFKISLKESQMIS